MVDALKMIRRSALDAPTAKVARGLGTKSLKREIKRSMRPGAERDRKGYGSKPGELCQCCSTLMVQEIKKEGFS